MTIRCPLRASFGGDTAQAFSTGSGRGRQEDRRDVVGHVELARRVPSALSRSRMAWAPSATLREISSR
jgi:hypothetical protein